MAFRNLKVTSILILFLVSAGTVLAQTTQFSAESTTRESVKVTAIGGTSSTVAQLNAPSGDLRFQKTSDGRFFITFWSQDETIDDLDYCSGAPTCFVNRCTTDGQQNVYWIDKASGRPAICVSANNGTEFNAASDNPWIGGAVTSEGKDDSGRYVVFDTTATVNGGAAVRNIVVHDRKWEETFLSQAKDCLDTAGPPDNDSVMNQLSSDGQFILFESLATNIMESPKTEPKCTYPNAIKDIFVRDGGSCKELAKGQCDTKALSDSYELHVGPSDVNLLNGNSSNARMSSDASTIVFETEATVPIGFLTDPYGNTDIFLHANGTFTMMSQRAVGFSNDDTDSLDYVNVGGPPNANSNNASISGDGMIVAFDSLATDLVIEDNGSGTAQFKSTGGLRQVYVHDRNTGKTTMVSVTPAGAAGNGISQRPHVSSNGNYVFFESRATNLVDGKTTNTLLNIYAYSTFTGEILLVTPGTNPSYPSDDTRTTGLGLNADATITHISEDGLSIGFQTTASNAINSSVDPSGVDNNGVQDVFIVTNACPDDTDGDGEPDCSDRCPEDAGKVEEGICGCGTADTDTDDDGVPDCNDQCEGAVDTDTDGDGTPDCTDECVDDSTKTEVGECGCGVPDVDANGNGSADCNDPDIGAELLPATVKFTRRGGGRFSAEITAGTTFTKGNVSYEFHVAKGKKVRKRTSTNPFIRVRIRKGQRYSVKYRVVAGSDVSEFSASKTFRKR